MKSICPRLFGRADEIPFAPSKGFVNGNKVGAGDLLDEAGLGKPLFISAAFELNHGGQGIHLIGNAAYHGIFRKFVHKFQKGSQPWFHKQNAALFPQYALHFRERLLQVFRQSG